MQNVTLKLPLSTLAMLHRLAEEEGISPGQIVREALGREIETRTLAKVVAANAPIRRRKRPKSLVVPLSLAPYMVDPQGAGADRIS
jgi:hypothetical protein